MAPSISTHQPGDHAFERTGLAATVCLVLAMAGIVLFDMNFQWPTSRLGVPPTEREILLLDVLPIVIAGYVSGLIAIAITRAIFPKSSIKVILYAAVAGAVLLSLPLMALSAAIGAGNMRDHGTVAMLFAVPLAVGTWALIAWFLPRRDAN